MASKFLNISTDTTLGGNSPSDEIVVSQKAIKTALDAKADDSSVVHKTGNETINGTKTFNNTLELKNNLSFRSYGSSDSGRLQFRAQPSDNVIRGTVAITDGYSISGSGYTGFVAQMVARAGSTTSDPFNTMRVSNKGIEYIKEANDGTITGQYIIVDDNGLVPSDRLATSGSVGQVLTKTASGQSWQTIGDSSFANTDLSNLSSTGKNISNWSSNVTNCITEIPQDIKLELNNGTLTLKAGSKVYVPNGEGVFDVITLSSDKSIPSLFATSGQFFLCVTANGIGISGWPVSTAISGTTPPSDSRLFYNTSTNEINWYSSGTKSNQYSFPVAVVTVSNFVTTSIDQLFNGFGYIGNALFALPGVKALYPDGRNDDGTVKSGSISLTSVFVNNITSTLDAGYYGLLTSSSVNAGPVTIQDNGPEFHSNVYERWYSPKLNKVFYHQSNETSWTQGSYVLFGNIEKTVTGYTKFEIKPVFRAADYSDLQNVLPSQTGQSGKFLTTNGSSVSWEALAEVATTGSYNDLSNKPTIPTTTDSITSGSSAALTSGGAYTNVVTGVAAHSTDSNKINVTKAGSTSTITIDNVSNATTATKVGSTTVGSSTTPIYLNNGTPTALSYTIAKSVPADAVFTDTTYSVFTGANGSTAGTSGLVKAPAATDNTKFLRGDCTWATVDALPSQSGQSGKFLTTNGTSASWATVEGQTWTYDSATETLTIS